MCGPLSTRIAGAAVSVGTTATQIVANGQRLAITIINTGTNPVFLGPSTVTTANGLELKADTFLRIESSGAIYGIVASGTEDVRYLEELSF